MFSGANSGTEKRRFGLLSVRKRTELSGGSFAIESAEGKATSIRAILPLKQSC
jgi:signal transduction histidine kinase